jgi:hypothetical protein
MGTDVNNASTRSLLYQKRFYSASLRGEKMRSTPHRKSTVVQVF